MELFRVIQLKVLRNKPEQQHSRSSTFLLIIPSLLIINLFNKLALATSHCSPINYPISVSLYFLREYIAAINKTDGITGADYTHYPLLYMIHGVLEIKLELTYSH